MKKRILSLSVLSLVCCLLCNTYIFAYDNSQKATDGAFNNTSLVEQGYNTLKNDVPNCRFCYAYDYDGDGMQEGYAISGLWEEGIVNGKLWFINSDGTYNIVKEGIYCPYDLLEPELVYAGNQIFLVCNQMQNGRVVSLICGYRNRQAYFPAISEKVTDFHSEIGHYYAYNIADYSGTEYFYNETTGEFGLDIKTENIDIDYLTRYYWYYDCGEYKKYQFNKDGTYIEYDSAGNIYTQGQRYSLKNNILTFHYEWGDSSWIYVDKNYSDALSYLPDGEKVFFAPDTGYENIANTHEEVPTSKEIKVVLNGKEIGFDQPPVVINDRVMVPIRAIFEALGYTVEWNQATQTAIATKGIDKIFVQLNSNEINYILKGSSGIYYCDTQPQMISDRILVPVRAIAESAGCEVTWDENESTVYINSNNEPKINAIIMNADAKLTSNDAGLVREVFLSNKLLPVSESNIHSMFEPDMNTFNRIVDLTISQAEDNDITFFYYSGHGGSDGYIFPTYNHETEDDSFALSPQKIIDTLEQIPGTIVVVLDSCYSGAINELSDIDTDKFKILTASEAGSYSNTSHLTVLPISTAQIGKFTEAFLNGLGGLEGGNTIYDSLTGRDGKVKADYNNDRKVTISELFEYIDKNMNKKYTVDGKIYYQNPTVSNKNDQTVIYAY